MVHVEIIRDGSESLCVEMTIGKSNSLFTCTCIYKHPSVTNEFVCLIFLLSVAYFIEIPWGYHLPGWHYCCPTESHTIKNISEQYDLMNLIKEPSCHKGPTSPLFDVIHVLNARRYALTLNVLCGNNDLHSTTGDATKRVAPAPKKQELSTTEVIQISTSLIF